MQRARARVQRDRVLGIDVPREFRFERRDFVAEDVLNGFEDLVDCLLDIVFDRGVLGFEIDQRYSDGSLSLTGDSLGAVGG